MRFITLICLVGYFHYGSSNFNSSLYPWPGFNKRMYMYRDMFRELKKTAMQQTRPVKDVHSRQLILFSFLLERILDFDTIKGTIDFYGRPKINYQHDLFTWNATETGVSRIDLLRHLPWIPDLVPLNAISAVKTNSDVDVYLSGYPEGYVFITDPMRYTFPCAVHLRNFPFDVQVCTFIFGSLSYSKEQFFLVPKSGLDKYFTTEEYFEQSEQWFRTAYFSKLVPVVKGGRVFEEIHIISELKRNSKFYEEFLLIPTGVISAVILTLFWIPAVRPDRTAVAQGVFGALMLLLLMVVRISPPSADMKLATYYCIKILLTVASTIISALIVSVSQKTSPVSRCMRVVFIRGVGSVTRITQSYEEMYPIPGEKPDPVLTAIRDWQIVATSLDRVCFVLYVFGVVIMVPLFFPYPAYTTMDIPPPTYLGQDMTGVKTSFWDD